jgi:hypothetical protein
MIISLNKDVNIDFKVYLVPNNFAKAIDENGNSVIFDITIDTIFTVRNCNNATPDATPSANTSNVNATRKRTRQQDDPISPTMLPSSDTPPLTPGSPVQSLDDNTTVQNQDEDTPMDAVNNINTTVQNQDEDTPMDAVNNREFTLDEITTVLKAVLHNDHSEAMYRGSARNSIINAIKKTDKKTMTLEEIEKVTLRNISKDTKEAFYKNLKDTPLSPSVQQGGASEENMNPVIYAGVSILVLLGALTGLKI